MAARVKVIGPAVVLKTVGGGERYLYRDDVAPVDAFEDESVARGIANGLLERIEAADPEPTDAPPELPSDSWNHERIDEWAAAQTPPIELVNPDPAKQFVKSDKLAQITAELEKRAAQ